MAIRVRFAPSPTGTLHLGSARTALFNWLYARHHGGTFVLRIEDTDAERSTDEAVAQALRVLEWMGLDWDEGPGVGGDYGPYVQTERREFYDSAVASLMTSGHAYECYCTPDELDAHRKASMAAGEAPIYSGRCRDLTESEREALRGEGRAVAIRFRVPLEGSTVVDDMIKGTTTFENKLLGDFIVRRADGLPVYNFACVVDDAAMNISHVVRGDDHLSNTPRQVLLYQALGREVPRFAHAPMILGPDKKKLSKRHGAASVEEMAEAGYVPEALRNYLALLGWSKDDETTIMSTTDLIEHFDVAGVNTSPAAFDYDKFKWMNGMHLRAMSADEFAKEYSAWREVWIGEDSDLHSAAFAATPEQAAFLVQEKVETLRDVPGLIGFLAEPFGIEDSAMERMTKVDEAPRVLEAALEKLASLEPFTVESVEGALRALCTELELKPRVCFGPLRIAVTGRTVSPGLFESIAALGRDRTLERLTAAQACFTSV
jgi:glutamyl-tRNA synthetase